MYPSAAIYLEWSNRSMIPEKNVRDMIYLVSCAVNNKIPDKTLVESMNLDDVYSIAASHMLSTCVAFALESAGYQDARSKNTIAMSLRRTSFFQYYLNCMRKAFEEQHIWFMPLKGAVLKDVYPKPGMREFSDFDILFDASREADLSAIMKELGFYCPNENFHYSKTFEKRPFLIFEMHTKLFSNLHDEKIYTYYLDVEKRLTGDGSEKKFTCEDMYLHMIAHEYKHYSFAGTGLRSILDTYIYLVSRKPDMDYVTAEAQKMGIADFEKQNRSLSLHLFGEDELMPEDLDMLNYIISSGAFGTRKNHVENELRQKKWSKLRYMLDKLSVPVRKKNIKYESFSIAYPLFYKHIILLPLLPFYRVFRSMKDGRFKAEANAIKKAK